MVTMDKLPVIREPNPGWYRDIAYPEAFYFAGFDGLNWFDFTPERGLRWIGPPQGGLFGFERASVSDEAALGLMLLEKFDDSNCR